MSETTEGAKFKKFVDLVPKEDNNGKFCLPVAFKLFIDKAGVSSKVVSYFLYS